MLHTMMNYYLILESNPFLSFVMVQEKPYLFSNELQTDKVQTILLNYESPKYALRIVLLCRSSLPVPEATMFPVSNT